MKKVTYRFDNLDCPKCAAKIERRLNEHPDISKAAVNFANKSIMIIYHKKPFSLNELRQVIKEVEANDLKLQELDIEGLSQKQKVFTKETSILLFRIIFSSLFLIVAMSFFWGVEDVPLWGLGIITSTAAPDFYTKFAFLIVAYLVVVYDIFIKVVKGFRRPSTIFNENFLMFFASVGAIVIGATFEGAMVIVLAQIGQLLEKISVTKSRNAVVDAISLRPTSANLVVGNEVKVVNPRELSIGEVIMVRLGETIPVDGVIIEGEGALNTASLTGETKPLPVQKGDEVMSGTTLMSGNIKMRVTQTFENSKIAKLIELVMNSGNNKSPVETLITKFARFYTPIMFILALLVFAIYPFVLGPWLEHWSQGLYITLTFLVVACPCAIVISVPIAYFCGIALASKNGIIVKGGNYLDALLSVNEVITDKTGTLTKGVFDIIEMQTYGKNQTEVQGIIRALEEKSNHPIAQHLRLAFSNENATIKVDDFVELPGFGVQAKINKQTVFFGNADWLKKAKLTYVKPEALGLALYLVIDNQVVAHLVLGDRLKEDALTFVKELKQRVIQVTMLSGDSVDNALAVANTLEIDHVQGNLLPADKVEYVARVKEKNKKNTLFIGDGVNDAACIVSSDVGIAMGGIGSDISVDNADIVIMNDHPSKLIDTMNIAKATRIRAIISIVVALVIKLTIMILSLFNLVNMWVAVLADTALTVVLIIQCTFLIRKKVRPVFSPSDAAGKTPLEN